MRADRLVSILLLLQVNRRITATELAQRLEVSERTIYRDMDALSAAGVPVVADRGAGGGWALLQSYETKLTGLNYKEIQSLFLTPERLLTDLGWRQAGESALIKLVASLPAMSRRSAEYARERIHIDSAGWNRSTEDISHLPVVQDAIWQERKLAILYGRDECDSTERQLDPLGLVAKGSAWYLVASVDGSPRTYRISRIREARILEDASDRPEDFDLAAYWERSATEFQAQLPRYYATIRVAPDAMPWVRWAVRPVRIENAEPADADGWVGLRIRFDVEEEALRFALGFGARAEAVDPPELRAEVLRAAEATVAMYSQRRQ